MSGWPDSLMQHALAHLLRQVLPKLSSGFGIDSTCQAIKLRKHQNDIFFYLELDRKHLRVPEIKSCLQGLCSCLYNRSPVTCETARKGN